MALPSKYQAALANHELIGKSTEEIARPDEHEKERKFKVDMEAFMEAVECPKPWMLVQGYFDAAHPDDEVSIRVIPARGIAFLRRKSKTFDGNRAKISVKVDYNQAVELLLSTPRQAFKHRHLVRDPEQRAWLVDYFPEQDAAYAETEFGSAKEMKALDAVPEWLDDEVTGVEEGYTRSRAIPHTESELRAELESAEKDGSTAPYEPSEDPTFCWKMVGGTWQE